MLELDLRGRLEAVTHIVTYHPPDAIERILTTCPADVAEAIRAHVARHGYRTRRAPLAPKHRAYIAAR